MIKISYFPKMVDLVKFPIFVNGRLGPPWIVFEIVELKAKMGYQDRNSETHGTMKVLRPKNIGEITPQNEGC